uniref:RNA polymerase subunit H/Rpb5 C-terminal domain-containing protein n=1 Tax=Populus trichocarpa TaxID=3694 RepID=A0A3N7E6V5_POPTR
MAATTETFNGNGASFHGVLDRDRCLTDFVDEGSAQSYRYYISRRTVLEMLKDRGYDVLDSELNRSLTEFRSVFGNSPDLDSLRFSVSLRSIPHKKITDLLVNITKHVLQPQMDILTAEQKQQVMNKYKLEDKQLPRMLESDAIVQYYGLQKGQTVKITYSGEIVDHLVTYRCVT